MLSMFLLLSIHQVDAMYFDDEDLSPFNYKTAEISTPSSNQLGFTHKTQCLHSRCQAADPLDCAPAETPGCQRSIHKITALASDGKKIGFIKIDGDDPCTFLRLHVYQFARGNGVGKQLLEQAVVWSKSHGCKQVAGIAYSGATDYYEKLGAICNPPLYDHDYLTTCRYTIPEDKI